MKNTRVSGAWGEAMAAAYLRRKHYKVLAVGYSCRFGEIDLIAQDRNNLVFVEVKLRKNADFAAAREYVDRRKRDRIRVTASMYLSQNPNTLPPRFDVIEIYAPQGTQTKSPIINHLEEAFE